MKSCSVSIFLFWLLLSFPVLSAEPLEKSPFNHLSGSELATLPPLPDGTPSIGLAGPLIGTSGNVLIIGGGANFPDGPPWSGGTKKYHDTLHILKRNSNGKYEWHPETYKLPIPIAYAACVSSPDGFVYCLGGENETGLLNTFYSLIWDEAKNKLLIEKVLNTVPFPPVANASAVMLDKKIYLIGGTTSEGASNTVSSFDLERYYNLRLGLNRKAEPSFVWQEHPPMPQKASHTVAVSQSDGNDTRIYVLGGRDKLPGEEKTTFFSTVYSYLPRKQLWTKHADIPVSSAAGCGVASGYGSILLFPAPHQEFFNENEALGAEIASTDDPEKKQALQKAYGKRIDDFKGFSRDIYLYSTITDVWAKYGELPFEAPVTTTSVWFDNKIVFPSGEIKPALRTPKINGLKIESPKTGFGAVNYAVLIGYFIGMLLLGAFFSFRNKSTNDFFRGGGRIPWWAIGISIFATALSSITFLSMPAKSYATDWRMFFYNFGILAVVPIITGVYLNYFRNLNLETAYEYLEKRFNSLTRLIASGLFCIFMVTRIAVVLFLPSLALSIVTSIDIYLCIVLMGIVTLLYCTMGGMEAVVWADVIQGAILVGGAVFSLFFLILNTDGGFSGFISTGTEMHKFHTFDFSWDVTQPIFVFVILGGFVNSLITYSSDQTIIQRYMSTKNREQAVKSIWLNAFLSIPITVVFFLIGTALFAYYRSHPLETDIVLRNTDAIFPHYMVNSLPIGISGLLIAAVFSAAMSTLSSNVNSVSAAITSDFIKKIVPNLGVKGELITARVAGIIAGTLGIIIAIILASSDIRSLWDQFNTFLGLFTSATGGLFLMGIFSKRINGIGAIAGIIGSLLAVWYVQSHTNFSFLVYGAIGMMACYITGWLISALTGFSNVKTVVPLPSENDT